jgi:hypothetical protein
MICRAVVTSFDESNWGTLVYALDDQGHNVVDAISAALIARSLSTAYNLRIRYTGKEVQVLEFHSTSFHGALNELPYTGQLVEVHLNDHQRLVAVWYDPREAS